MIAQQFLTSCSSQPIAVTIGASVADGVDEDAVEEAEDSEQPKAAVIELVLAIHRKAATVRQMHRPRAGWSNHFQ